MKGLNIKKVVALGIGAALVGSALAPVVSAANMVSGGLSGLEKSHIVSSTGAPIVDVIVGSQAAVSDVVWAGNIAAKVAQLANVAAGDVVAGGCGACVVNATVGGTLVTTGAGETAEGVFDFNNQEAGLNAIQVTNTQMPSLVNEPAAKLKWDSTSYSSTSVSEDLNAVIDAQYNSTTGSSRYAVGELVGSVAKQTIFYNVNLGSGIDINADITGMDANSRYDVKIPFLGKTYVLDEIDASEERMVLYANTNPTDLKTGETVVVTPSSSYAGKDMVIELVDLVQTGSGTNTNTYEAKWALKIDGSVVKYVQKAPSTAYNLKDEFGTGYFADDIYVTAAGLNLAANTYTATIRSGTDRIELRNGYGFPYTGTNSVDQDAEWKVIMEGAASDLVTKISLTNQWKYDKLTGSETNTSKYVLKVGEEIVLPNDFAKVKFMGLEDKATKDVLVGAVDGIANGGIKYYDAKGTEINVPFHVQFDLEENKPRVVQIGSQEYTFWIDYNAANNLNFIKGDYSSAENQVGASWNTAVGPYVDQTVLTATPIELDLGAKTSTGAIDYIEYLFVVDNTSDQAALVLNKQTFDIYDKAKDNAKAILAFVDTNTNNGAGETFYVPNSQEFLNVINGGNIATYDSDIYMAAKLLYTDNNGDTATLYVRAGDDATVWNYEAIKDETTYGPTKDAVHANWTSAIRDGSDYLLEGMTTDGTLIVSDNEVFTISVPEEQRLVQAYLGSDATSTSAVGGQSFTGLGSGDSETVGGVQLTIDSASCGATTGGEVQGVSIVKVPKNLVKTDASRGGRSIIVGGWVVNAAAQNLEVSGGQTLQDLVTASGEYVAAVLNSGDIVVAGWTAADTGSAATELINALEALV